jgi:hypothetical protein
MQFGSAKHNKLPKYRRIWVIDPNALEQLMAPASANLRG